jgi:hypothetical protein
MSNSGWGTRTIASRAWKCGSASISGARRHGGRNAVALHDREQGVRVQAVLHAAIRSSSVC